MKVIFFLCQKEKMHHIKSGQCNSKPLQSDKRKKMQLIYANKRTNMKWSNIF